MKKLKVDCVKLFGRLEELILNENCLEDVVICLNAAEMLFKKDITTMEQDVCFGCMIAEKLDNYLMEDEINA